MFLKRRGACALRLFLYSKKDGEKGIEKRVLKPKDVFESEVINL